MGLGLLGEVSGLGLAAVDVVGIAFMPVLLAQVDGERRARVFLLGSFVALLAWGMVFTTGLGSTLVEVQVRAPWLVPGVEAFGGLVVLAFGAVTMVRVRRGRRTGAPGRLVQRLTLPRPLLFGFGFLLVSVQSVVDVVFVVAMVDVGARALPVLEVCGLVLAYAVAALLIQVAVVVVYRATPPRRRASAMAAFADWLALRGELWAGVVSLGLGAALLIFSGPDLLSALRAG